MTDSLWSHKAPSLGNHQKCGLSRSAPGSPGPNLLLFSIGIHCSGICWVPFQSRGLGTQEACLVIAVLCVCYTCMYHSVCTMCLLDVYLCCVYYTHLYIHSVLCILYVHVCLMYCVHYIYMDVCAYRYTYACCVFFICLGGIRVHVLLSAVVFCVSYVLVICVYVWCGSLWYMCVVENCVSYVVSEVLSIIHPDPENL